MAGSAVKWLRDTMSFIEDAAGVNTLAAKETDTGGVYFVTAFSGLLAPYWDSGAGGLIIGELKRDAKDVNLYGSPRSISVYEPLAYCARHIGSQCFSDPRNHREHET